MTGNVDPYKQAQNLILLVLHAEKKYQDAKAQKVSKDRLDDVEGEVQLSADKVVAHLESYEMSEDVLSELITWVDGEAEKLGVTVCPAGRYLEKRLDHDALNNTLSRLFPAPPAVRQKVNKI